MNEQPSKIYLLPNLMTAGNLFCGFTATLKILEGALLQASNPDAAGDLFHTAIWCVLGAFVFDFLDGRLARLGGHESPFGREFDSLADIVSFGLAPALMVYRVVLQEFPRDYPDAHVFVLDENHRSTATIVSLANAIAATLSEGSWPSGTAWISSR